MERLKSTVLVGLLERIGLSTLECVASSLERRGYRNEARYRDRGSSFPVHLSSAV